MRRALMVAGAILCFAPLGWSQAPPAPAAAPSAADLAAYKATLEALQQKIKEQDQRIAELETKQGNDEKARREEIIAVLKEMNLIGDKKATDIHVYYKDGLHFDTADDNFHLALNGRIYADAVYLSAPRASSRT